MRDMVLWRCNYGYFKSQALPSGASIFLNHYIRSPGGIMQRTSKEKQVYFRHVKITISRPFSKSSNTINFDLNN